MAVRSSAHKWKIRYLLVVLMVLVTIPVKSIAGKVNISDQRNQEIELMLKKLNKQPVKSIESSNGEIIDCISITKQPAFDHPMLKNHTIQMMPSSFPHEGFSEEDNASAPSNDKEQPQDIVQPWHMAGECPDNTIPIKRTTRDDLLRVDNIKDYGRKIYRSKISQPHQFHHPTATTKDNGHEYAIMFAKNRDFRGIKAQINVWKPRVQEDSEVSISQVWMVGGPFGPGLNTIEAGANVSPSLYGDRNPHIFIYWTSDGYGKTGCYNHACSGFVQTNKRISLGAPLEPISTYNGPQYMLIVHIWKDPKTGNWWLQLNENYLMGYWPNELLPNLANAASEVQWGGEIVNQKQGGQHTTTEMGSGHFPSEGFKKASHFRVVKVIDKDNRIVDPVDVQTSATRPTCYDIKTGYTKLWGVFFYFGGPGRNPMCP